MTTTSCNIKELDIGTWITSCFCVLSKKVTRPYKNGFRFDATLANKSGEIELTYWGGQHKDAVDKIYDSFSIDDIVSVSGSVSVYQNEIKLSINEGKGEIRKAEPNEYNVNDFIHKTNRNVDEMWRKIVEIKDSLSDPHLKALLDAFFSDGDFVKDFKKAPAAEYYHHACAGGLLEHTEEVLRYCETIASIHTSSLNKDLLFTGAILHDIGKVKELNVKMSIKLSEEGVLLGHVFIGVNAILEKISGLATFPPLLEDKLIHLILSHHGKNEWGALLEPRIPEAAALHYADLMSSKVTQYIRAKKDAATDDFMTYDRRIRSRVFLK